LTILDVNGLSVTYRTMRGDIHALDRVDLSVRQGETIAVVGESGSGKTTLGLAIVKLLPPNGSYAGGDILIEGKGLREMSDDEVRSMRGRTVFMIFQDPLNSLNPVKKVGMQILEALHSKKSQNDKVPAESVYQQLIDQIRDVRIPDPEVILERYPHQLSGGQIQRTIIAMGLLLRPKVLIAYEPTSALDVTVQAQILKLLNDLKHEYGMSVIFITHDISVAYNVADRIAVMYAGKIIEIGPAETVIKLPSHPYTRALISSLPTGTKKDGRLQAIRGVPASMMSLPPGCRYHPRCPYVMDVCRTTEPTLLRAGESLVSCWLYDKKISNKAENGRNDAH
jgi:peptide/nickel transport system ATP-binding protein